MYYSPVARILHGEGVRMSASGTLTRAPQERERRGCGSVLPQEILKKICYLRQHVVRFEERLLGQQGR